VAEQKTNWILELVDKLSGPMGKVKQSMDDAGKSSDTLDNNFGKLALNAVAFQQISQSISQLSGHLDAAIAPGVQFDKTMAEVSAITGFTGDALDDMGMKARALAKEFGGSASDQANGFKVILSRLGPEMAKDSAALELMGKNVAMLSKTMGGDATGAVSALTTAMNQYGVDLSNPMDAANSMTEIMDIMAKGAQIGSAEVTQVADAFKVAGLVAKDSGIGLAEFNAAIQVAGKGALYGSEAGTQLRNVFNKLSMGRFLPTNIQEELRKAGVNVDVLGDKSLSLQDRLQELKKIESDGALIQGFFGEGGANAAKTLLANIDLLDQFTGELENATGSTREQADIIGGSYTEKMARFRAQLEDVAISFFNATKGAMPFIQGGMQMVTVMSQVASAGAGVKLLYSGMRSVALSMGGALKVASMWTMNLGKQFLFSALGAIRAGASYLLLAVQGLGGFIASIITATAAQWGLNIAMNANPIGLIVLGILAIGAAVWGLIEYWDVIKEYLISFAEFMIKLNVFYWIIELVEYIFPGFKDAVVEFFGGIYDWLVGWATKIWDKMKEVWNGIKSLFGFGSDETATIKVDSSGNAKIEGMDDITLDTGAEREDPFKKSPTSAALTTSKASAGDDKGTTVSGTGSGKQITMNLDIVLNFPLPENFESRMNDIKDKVTEAIVDAGRDALVSLG
jgi:TP901 family phage tail tape measure protein